MPTRAYHRVLAPGGTFHFVGVPEGNLHLVVRVPGYAEKSEGPYAIQAGSKIESLTIEVGAGAVVHGRVESEDGTGIAGASVRLSREAANQGDAISAFLGPLMKDSAPSSRATTDGSGNFRAAGLSDGRWSIDVTHPDYGMREPVNVLILPKTPEIAMNPITMVQGGSIAGVVMSDGEPDPKARVQIVTSAGKLIGQDIATDSEGRFLMKGLVPGHYTIRVLSRRGTIDLFGPLLASQARSPDQYQVYGGKVTEVTLKEPGK
jgi:hypothetical protein